MILYSYLNLPEIFTKILDNSHFNSLIYIRDDFHSFFIIRKYCLLALTLLDDCIHNCIYLLIHYHMLSFFHILRTIWFYQPKKQKNNKYF